MSIISGTFPDTLSVVLSQISITRDFLSDSVKRPLLYWFCTISNSLFACLNHAFFSFGIFKSSIPQLTPDVVAYLKPILFILSKIEAALLIPSFSIICEINLCSSRDLIVLLIKPTSGGNGSLKIIRPTEVSIIFPSILTLILVFK